MNTTNKFFVAAVFALSTLNLTYSQVIMPDSAVSGKRPRSSQDSTQVKSTPKDTTIKKPDSLNRGSIYYREKDATQKKATKTPSTNSIPQK